MAHIHPEGGLIVKWITNSEQQILQSLDMTDHSVLLKIARCLNNKNTPWYYANPLISLHNKQLTHCSYTPEVEMGSEVFPFRV